MSRSLIKASLILVLFFVGCNPIKGCVESEFTLSPESRLPRWFTIPLGYTRKDLSMTMTDYVGPFGITVEIVLRGPVPDYKVLMKKEGSSRIHPLTKQRGFDKYPNYSIISVDSIEEVFEQRRLEPILYITDDPKLTSALKQQKAPQ